MHASSQVLDRIAVSFDDEHAVALAGLILPAAVSGKLGLEQAGDEVLGVGYRRVARPPRSPTGCSRAATSKPKDSPTAPRGVFNASAARLVLATLAHNLARWTARLGDLSDGALVAKTLRRRHLAVPGRPTHTARRWRLALSARWPWRQQFLTALERIRALPSLAPG